MLKNKFKAALLSLTVAFALPLSTHAMAQDKEIIVATDTAFVPFEFKDGDKYTGFDIDLFNAIAADAGLKVKWQPMDFNGIIPGLQAKNLDAAIAGITIKEERKKAVDFSDPYYDSGIAILVNQADADKYKSVADLAGKKIAVKTGTSSVDFVKENIPTAKAKLFPNIDNAFLDLQTKRVDAVIHDTPNVQYYANTAGKGRVVVSAKLRSGEFYGIAFPKGSPLVGPVNASLKKLRENGEYQKIYAKWFGDQATQ